MKLNKYIIFLLILFLFSCDSPSSSSSSENANPQGAKCASRYYAEIESLNVPDFETPFGFIPPDQFHTNAFVSNESIESCDFNENYDCLFVEFTWWCVWDLSTEQHVSRTYIFVGIFELGFNGDWSDGYWGSLSHFDSIAVCDFDCELLVF